MSESNSPSVCAAMLVNGRAAMVERALRSFAEQTYPIKRLLIVDNGEKPVYSSAGSKSVMHVCIDRESRSIGQLRNYANGVENYWYGKADIICHWDSDDWSHPRRIEEQVALLQASGKECVGYRDMLFWNHLLDAGKSPTLTDGEKRLNLNAGGECWLYSNNDPRYCLGTSLCYWRRVWEARPFPDEPKRKGGTGEDVKWLEGVKSLGASSIEMSVIESDWKAGEVREGNRVLDFSPRMIASIHGGNTQAYDLVVGQSPSWRRAPEWDAHCRGRMAL